MFLLQQFIIQYAEVLNMNTFNLEVSILEKVTFMLALILTFRLELCALANLASTFLNKVHVI